MLGAPKRDRLAERREATRQEILDAAWATARERGLANLTLREVAERVGMRTPSLYTHFDSKNAVYDAMFGQAWTQCLSVMTACLERLPASPRSRMRLLALAFFDFCIEDLARYQLMSQRTVVDFEPSPASYAPSVETLQRMTGALLDAGAGDPTDMDLVVALLGGLIDAQLAHEPGGERWRRLVEPAMDMVADHLGICIEGTDR